MMLCPNCKQENPDRARFCNSCGAKLDGACPKCGHANPPSSRFCNECGLALNQSSAPAPDQRFSSPDSYTPKHLAERILLSKEALEGERKQVTVLFADLKGSMELLADRDPEEARRVLDPVVEKMMEAVHRYEGTVNQVMGDGIMALFGAPLALEDHAVRACYAALAMQSSVRSYSEQLRRLQGLEVQIRVGLNSGEVVVRAIGSDLHMDYTAVGQTTHLAARMEQLSAPGTTRLTASTLGLAEGFIKVTPLGPVPVKGLAEAIEVFELTGAGAARSRLQAAATRGLTRFVGRSSELAQMFSALERSHAGHGEIVALLGEPGVGKSRLVWEFTRSRRLQGWLVLESASVSYGKASAYRPVIDLLKSYFQIEDRDDARRIREKLTGKLLTLDEVLKPHLVPLLALLDIAVEDESWKPLDSMQKRQRTLDACKRLVLREAQVQPLVVVFEDLHWIDGETQAFLDSLVESLPGARVLVLVNFRPEYQPRWATKTYYTQLRIDPLSAESAEQLLQTLLGTDPSLKLLSRMLIQRTEGNPLYLEESVRTLVETGELQGARGAYRLTTALTNIQVPATVQAILASRIDRLAPQDKHLLQAASVIGKDVPLGILREIAEVPEEQVRQGLVELQSAEFLYETTLFPDLEYTFKHALTHEVAYGSVLQERRKVLHGRILEAMEQLYTDRLAEQTDFLAHHAFRGEVWDKAAAYLRQAGLKAFSRSANREAVILLEQAILALSHLPRGRECLEQEADLRTAVCRSLVPLGELERVIQHTREIEPLAKALNDPRLEALAHAFMSSALADLGQLENGIEHGMQALAVADSLEDPALEVFAKYALGKAHMHRGAHRKATEFFQRNVGLEPDQMPPSSRIQGVRGLLYGAFTVAPRSYCETNTGYCLAELGEFEQAIEHCERAVKIAEVHHDLGFVRANADAFLGFVYLRQGKVEKAITVTERSLGTYAHADVPLGHLVLAHPLGAAYNFCERVPEAIALLEQAWRFAESRKHFSWGQPVLAHLADAYGRAGRIDEAVKTAQRALEVSRQYGQRGYETWTLYLLGNIYTYPNPPSSDQAHDAYRQALALAQEFTMRPLQGQCHLALGTIDTQSQARDHLDMAVIIFRELDMQFWLDKAECVLRTI